MRGGGVHRVYNTICHCDSCVCVAEGPRDISESATREGEHGLIKDACCSDDVRESCVCCRKRIKMNDEGVESGVLYGAIVEYHRYAVVPS